MDWRGGRHTADQVARWEHVSFLYQRERQENGADKSQIFCAERLHYWIHALPPCHCGDAFGTQITYRSTDTGISGVGDLVASGGCEHFGWKWRGEE